VVLINGVMLFFGRSDARILSKFFLLLSLVWLVAKKMELNEEKKGVKL